MPPDLLSGGLGQTQTVLFGKRRAEAEPADFFGKRPKPAPKAAAAGALNLKGPLTPAKPRRLGPRSSSAAAPARRRWRRTAGRRPRPRRWRRTCRRRSRPSGALIEQCEAGTGVNQNVGIPTCAQAAEGLGFSKR